MKQFAEITYDKINENEEYSRLINRVIEKCFEIEHLYNLKLYMSVRLTNNEVIKEINAKYRNIDIETDVLSFPMFEKVVMRAKEDVVLNELNITRD